MRLASLNLILIYNFIFLPVIVNILTCFLLCVIKRVHISQGSPEVALAGQMLENLPPIGVFWDIENCSVPSGRSATAVVQRIREKFFKGHREAEFICVCDISKENKEVIQELNNCQVDENSFFFFILVEE